MAEFEDTLNAILSDPDTMGQIMTLAGKLGGGDPPPQTQEPPPEQPFPLPDLGQAGKLLELVLTVF